MKAQLPLKGTVAASDAFLPVPRWKWKKSPRQEQRPIIQPEARSSDPEVIAAADRLGLAMLFTGKCGTSALTVFQSTIRISNR